MSKQYKKALEKILEKAQLEDAKKQLEEWGKINREWTEIKEEWRKMNEQKKYILKKEYEIKRLSKENQALNKIISHITSAFTIYLLYLFFRR